MSNINIHNKKFCHSFQENTLCFISGLLCICTVLYACYLFYPFAEKVMGNLTDGIEVMNNAVKGGYR